MFLEKRYGLMGWESLVSVRIDFGSLPLMMATSRIPQKKENISGINTTICNRK